MIQRLQNRAARIVTGNYDYVSTRGTELVKRLKWMCVTQRRDYFIIIIIIIIIIIYLFRHSFQRRNSVQGCLHRYNHIQTKNIINDDKR